MKTRFVVLATLTCAVAAVAFAQQKVAGEKWRMKMSMQAEGFSMPGRTMEMCLPKGEPQQAVLQQQEETGNCAVSNVRQQGGRFSADIKCTGSDGMDGHIEMEQLGADAMRGSMTGRTADGSMKMEYAYTRLGQACEAVDYSNYRPPVVATAPMQQLDFCQQIFDGMKADDLPGLVTSIMMGYPKPDGSGMQDCTTHAAFPKFCAAVQTPAGYASLEHQQWQYRTMDVEPNETPYARAARLPLDQSLQMCGLGNDAAAAVKLQKQLAATARRDGQWGFALYYDADAHYGELQALAKTECSGRSFTNAGNKQYLNLCSNYGRMLVRDDRAGVMGAAGCSRDREDPARGICIGATATAASGAAAGAGGSATATDAPADEEAGASGKARDALDKGRKALRGIFGGG